LPPSEKFSRELIEFYVVRNDNKLAVFDKNGLNLFGFEECYEVEIDEHTKTVVKILKDSLNFQRSYVYDFNKRLLFNESFEGIGYVTHSDLIALIKEDGARDIFYLYNPFTKLKLGPFSHFNVYNEDTGSPLGVSDTAFNKYRSLNFIAVRKTVGNDYLWGVVDLKGKELLPVEYRSFRALTPDMQENFVNRSKIKPEGIDFWFYGYFSSDRSENRLFLFDSKLNTYVYDGDLRSITLVKRN
jgi:hypothetical protein